MSRVYRAAAVAGLVGGLLMILSLPAFAPCHIGSFVGAPYRVSEGAGKVVVIYSNGAGQQPGGTVDYRTVNGSATAPSDYRFTSGTLRWGAAGGTASASAASSGTGINPAYRSFEVPIRQDSVDERAETFRIMMSHFTGCFDAASSDKTATVTIVDDDQTAQGSPSSSPSSAQSSVPTSSGKPSASPTPAASASTSASPSPSATPTAIAVGERDSDGGLSGGAVAGIVGGVIVVGGAAAFVVRRRFLT